MEVSGMMDRVLQIMAYWEMWRRAWEYHDWGSVDRWSRAIERRLECWC